MAHRHTSFRKEWLRKTDSNDVICSLWVEQYDESTAYCRLCDQKINVKSQGFSAINQHSKGKHHKLKSQSLQNNNHVNVHEKSPASTTGTRNLKQQVLFPIKIAQPDTPEPAIVSGPSIFSATTMSTERKPCNIKDSATTAECLWGFKTAHANYSFNSSKGLPNLLKRMAPDSLILDKFRMSPGKVSYLLGIFEIFQSPSFSCRFFRSQIFQGPPLKKICLKHHYIVYMHINIFIFYTLTHALKFLKTPFLSDF